MAKIRCFLLRPHGTSVIQGPRESPLYVRADTGAGSLYVLGLPINWNPAAPPGAMWYAPWYGDVRGGMFLAGKPEDGWLVVRTPGGDWMPDMRSHNCTRLDDDEHRCWVRHGAPPDVTVDKRGLTCSAGAGSIRMGSYHGFLRDGWLED